MGNKKKQCWYRHWTGPPMVIGQLGWLVRADRPAVDIVCVDIIDVDVVKALKMDLPRSIYIAVCCSLSNTGFLCMHIGYFWSPSGLTYVQRWWQH